MSGWLLCAQPNDVSVLDEAMIVLTGLAIKDPFLPAGMVPYLAERFLPHYCVSLPNSGLEGRRSATTILASSPTLRAFLIIMGPCLPAS